MRIAHLADIHIPFNHTRKEEFEQVFERTYKDLKEQSPDRIFIAGDIYHNKINMSPSSTELLSEFLITLSNIAPTDIILGNHDLNEKQLKQGDAVSPIIEIINKIQINENEKKAYVVNNDNKYKINFEKNAIYCYEHSGFYHINDKIVYGVFSCKDNEILTLNEDDKDPNKTYIALYHGTLYGSRRDNGYIAEEDNLITPSTFNGFDIAMLGDIHEYQTFETEEEKWVDEDELEKYIQAGWYTEDEDNEQMICMN